MRLLHIASEIAPYAKTGGLGDVVGALPRALAANGHAVTVVVPRYRMIDPARYGLVRHVRSFATLLGGTQVEFGIYEANIATRRGSLRIFFVDHACFDRDGIYGTRGEGDFGDNAWRFALLGKAAWTLVDHFALRPDIVHGHDWEAGAALLYGRSRPRSATSPRFVFTIHNLAYQGVFAPQTIDALDLPMDRFHIDGFEFYGQVNFLKAGVVCADHITTVSRRYAEEIQTPELGERLDGLLRARSSKLSGIVNGADYEAWNPATDPALVSPYDRASLLSKRVCKSKLQSELGLRDAQRVPLFIVITRLVEQKGISLIRAVLPQMLERDTQWAILGTGDVEQERALEDLAKKYPGKIAVRLAHDEGLAHRMLGGGDLFVMPSRYEPCGLTQLYALRYGTPPIVRATGGLDETIVDADMRSSSGTGFKFKHYTDAALAEACMRALAAYHSGEDFTALIERAMAQNFSWSVAAERYAALYERLTRAPSA